MVWKFDLPDMAISMSFNRNGNRLVTTCKDRRTRIHDSRTGLVLRDGQLHEGVKVLLLLLPFLAARPAPRVASRRRRLLVLLLHCSISTRFDFARSVN